MAEVFGFRIDDMSPEARRHRGGHLCPFNNREPSCTKDKANDPLGVCSIYHGIHTAITCPIRFRENWQIATDAAAFFFPPEATWTALSEIRLQDSAGKSAGNIDLVLAAYNDEGKVVDFGALEIQGVYISGNIRKPFAHYMADPQAHSAMQWSGQKDYPRPDYLSSSRKRLAPQLIYKGGILHPWKRKLAVAIDSGFYAELPHLPSVPPSEAEIAWLVYDLQLSQQTQRYTLTLVDTVYTKFKPALATITTANPGSEADFLRALEKKLNKQRDSGSTATIPSFQELVDESEEEI